MKGNNSLTLNQETMKEAVEHWLRNKVWHPYEDCPHVTSVKSDGGYCNTFTVELSDTAEE